MNFFEKNKKKIKKISAGLLPRTPQRDPQNLCLQGKLMALTLHLAIVKKKTLGTREMTTEGKLASRT